MKHLNYLFVLLVLGFIISSGIHIFSKGFLLTRETQKEFSKCDKFYIRNECLSENKVMNMLIAF